MTSAPQPVNQVTVMIVLRTQANHSFDRKFVFTALHRRFNCFIFSILIWLVSPSLFLFAQYQAITHSAPKGDLLAPPVQRQRRAFLHLIYSIGHRTVWINQWFSFHSGHTLVSNEDRTCSVHVFPLNLRRIPEVWNMRFEFAVANTRHVWNHHTMLPIGYYLKP